MNSEEEQQYDHEPNGSSINSSSGGLEMVFLPYFESLEDWMLSLLCQL
jgi:hypothetical protein